MKYHATERMRQSVNDAMDVHAGRGVIDGPRNYLGSLYRAVPIAITVEGANILTRNLIIFGQGAIRAHPYLMPEMLALGNPDEERGMEVFHDVFWRHLRHVGMTSLRAIGRAWTGGMLAPTPTSGPTARHYRRLGRYAAGFALLADASLASLGGALSAASCSPQDWATFCPSCICCRPCSSAGKTKAASTTTCRWCAGAWSRARLASRAPWTRCCPTCRAGCWPGACAPPSCRCGSPRPDDALTRECAELLLKPSPTHDRLAAELQREPGPDPLGQLTRAFALAEAVQLRDRLRQSGLRDWREAHRQGAITDAQAAQLEAAEASAAEVLQVDDFAPEELSPGAGRDNAQPAAIEAAVSRRPQSSWFGSMPGNRISV